MRLRYLLLVLVFAAMGCNSKDQAVTFDPSQGTKEVDSFMTRWHDFAADSDARYFEAMTDNGVYIGTDKTERWKRADFQQWSQPYFDPGKGWDFNATSRNIQFSEEGQIAWVDELLETHMGVCRGSAVLSRRDSSWGIELYHLALTVPNDTLNTVKEIIAAYEKRAER